MEIQLCSENVIEFLMRSVYYNNNIVVEEANETFDANKLNVYHKTYNY